MLMNPRRYLHTGCTLAVLLGGLLTFVACAPKTKPSDEKQPVPLYKKDTVIRFKVEQHIYLARVQEDTFSDDQRVPVHIFTPQIQRRIGDTISIKDVKNTREEPEAGWGTARVAVEYFDGTKWQFSWDVQAMEDHYLLPETFQGVRYLEFSNVRFRVPVQR